MKLKDLLPENVTSQFSEESLKTIEEAFQQAVDKIVSDKIALAVENAEVQFDAEAKKKMDELVNITETHHRITSKQLAEALKQRFETREANIHAFYKQQIAEAAKQFKTHLVEKLNVFFDNYLEKAIPSKKLKESVANNYARVSLAAVKKVLCLTDEKVKTHLKKPIMEGMSKMKELERKVSLLEQRNQALNTEMSSLKAKEYLTEKVKNWDPAAQSYMMRVLADKPIEFIKENFDYTKSMCDQIQENELKQIAKDEIAKKRVNSQKFSRGTIVEANQQPKQTYKPKSEAEMMIELLESSGDIKL